MTLLDRFRTAPRQKHPDPAVRLAFVSEVPLDDRETIAAIAREDEDPRVRRAAVAKLMDPAMLGSVARDDADESVRAQALAMLRDLALEAFEATGESEGLDAVDAMSDQRTLTQIARTAPREIVALRALSRINDPHAWGSIARHGGSEPVRRGALVLLRERGEQSEILAVAMNGEFKDTALACVELVTNRDELEQIAAKSKNKSAAKRARAILREAEERAAATEAARAGADVRELPPRPDASAGAAAAVESPAEIEQREQELAAARARADAAELEARQAREARERERQERHALDAEHRHARFGELASHAEAAAADPDLASARKVFGLARREWTELASGAAADEGLAVRFHAAESTLAARDAEAREHEARSRREAFSRLQHLLNRVEPLAAKTDLSLKAAERAVRDVRTALADLPSLPTRQDADDIGRRLKAAQTTLAPRLQELRDADDWQRWANAGVQEQLCVQMEALQAIEDPEIIARDVRSLQEQWRKSADVPRAQADALWRRFKAAHDVVWPRCEAHFAAEAKERTENLAKKTALCEAAEALADSTRWIQTAEEIKRLQAEWKAIGAVPRGRERAVWERFRSACDRFFTRRHEDLAQRKVLWAENLAKKLALCEQAEALASSTEWEQAAAGIKRLQAEWKTIGPVKKTRSEAIWQRFRAACDAFFARYAQRHDLAREERVAAREAICAELAAFAPEDQVGASAKAGAPEQPVEGSAPEPAVDTSAPAAGSAPEDSVGASASDGEAAPVSTEAASPGEPAADTEPPPDLLSKVRTLRARWQQEIAARGVDPDRARALDQRFAAAHARVLARWPAVFAGTDLDPDANRKRMEALVHRVEALAKSAAGPADLADALVSPSVRLAAMLKEALAANTIGGKVDDDSRWRAAAEEVRQAQASWSRIGPVPDATRRALADRFQRASRRVLEKAGDAGLPPARGRKPT